MAKGLYDPRPLKLDRVLASKIGLNEAIILQQIQYWTEKNEAKNNNFRDGHFWVFNTVPEWQEQFSFWCTRTIERTLAKLEKDGLLIVGNFNLKRYDRTKWYRIDYDKLENTVNPKPKEPQEPQDTPSRQSVVMDADNVSGCIPTTCRNGCRQVDTMDTDYVSGPIPETTTETTYIAPSPKNEGVLICLKAFNDAHKKKTGEEPQPTEQAVINLLDDIYKPEHNRFYFDSKAYKYFSDFKPPYSLRNFANMLAMDMG